MKTQISRGAAAMILTVLMLTIGLASGPVREALAAEDIVVQTTDAPFAKVVTNLKRAITGQKLVIIKEVPYQQMLGMVGVKAEKMMGFEIFHPRYGKTIYNSDPAALVEVPLRVLVREASGKVSLEYRKPSIVFAPYSGLSALGEELDQKFADIVAQVAK
jgi:uncharacterized protein (DUF302 family)